MIGPNIQCKHNLLTVVLVAGRIKCLDQYNHHFYLCTILIYGFVLFIRWVVSVCIDCRVCVSLLLCIRSVNSLRIYCMHYSPTRYQWSSASRNLHWQECNSSSSISWWLGCYGCDSFDLSHWNVCSSTIRMYSSSSFHQGWWKWYECEL